MIECAKFIRSCILRFLADDSDCDDCEGCEKCQDEDVVISAASQYFYLEPPESDLLPDILEKMYHVTAAVLPLRNLAFFDDFDFAGNVDCKIITLDGMTMENLEAFNYNIFQFHFAGSVFDFSSFCLESPVGLAFLNLMRNRCQGILLHWTVANQQSCDVEERNAHQRFPVF